MTTEDAAGGRPTPAETPPDVPQAGWWPSPWSAAQVAAGKVSRGGLQADGGIVYWTESRPDEGGRQVVVGTDPAHPGPAGPDQISPAGVSVRSRVHEYGGGAATVAGGVLFYVDQGDQAWYRLDLVPGAVPVQLGDPPDPASSVRHADGRPTPDGTWWISVAERHGSDPGVDSGAEPGGGGSAHELVAMSLDGSGPARVVAHPGDFVAAPRPSPDGRWLAWVTWDHPDMPWDAGRLQVVALGADDDGIVLGDPVTVAGGPGVSVGQPQWAADGALLFVDDRTGWWLPYRIPAGALAGGVPSPDAAVALVDDEAEYHEPDWVFGQHTLEALADGSVAAVRRAEGRDALVVLHPPAAGRDAPGWTWSEVVQPCVSLSAVVTPDGRRVAVFGSTPTEAQSVFVVDPSGAGPPVRLSAPPAAAVEAHRASASVPLTGRSDGMAVPGHFFAPVEPDAGPAGPPPPLVVFCHGGPTSSAPAGYDPVIQFLTSRGIAVAAVDYRGSSGHGRAYRDLLRGAWGEGDVDDCVGYAESLVAAGLVDGTRMAIRGTSAGGLTALAALVRARCFAGAVAWYGVTDLVALAADTHDFESRYLDSLVGPLPEAAPTYRDRSPVHHADRVAGRVLLLQGAEDPVVPLSQAEQFAAELVAGGNDCRLVVFEGEAHGFRRADTIEAALTAELDFYRELFAPEATGGR